MTDEELAAVEARCRAATPGPWEYGCGSVTDWRADRSPEYTTELLWNRHAGKAQRDADGAFIASARVDVPLLLAEARRLRALLAGEAAG